MGVTLAEGWASLGRGVKLCLPVRMFDHPTSEVLPTPGVWGKGTQQGPEAAAPLLVCEEPLNSGNWEQVGRLSDTSMGCQQGRDFWASRDL